MKPIPFLLTLDIHEMDRLAEFIAASLEFLSSHGIRATYYATSHLFARHGDALREIPRAGHQLASHGLDHQEEFYDILDEREQRRRIAESTRVFLAETGCHPRSFRAPGFRISGAALKILADAGYTSDSSVNSQRLAVTSSNLLDHGWLLSARRPYHPSARNPFRRGGLDILEVPVSAFGIALTMTFLEVLSSTLFKAFFGALRRESLSTGKPIVYASHPEDFAPFAHFLDLEPLKLRFFLPSRTGFYARHYLKERDPEVRCRKNKDFLRHVLARRDVQFMTMDEYVASRGSRARR